MILLSLLGRNWNDSSWGTMKGHDGLDWTDEGFGASDTALLSRMKDEGLYAYFFSDAAEFSRRCFAPLAHSLDTRRHKAPLL